jgi:sarcosine oxidase
LSETYDAAVIGAGAFGAWCALHLRRAGRSVMLLDAYGAGNNRSSSGGESRIIRMGYGAEEIYTRWAMRSLTMWLDLFQQVGDPCLFHRTGLLWTAPRNDGHAARTRETLLRCGVEFEELAAGELARQFPQITLPPDNEGIFEPNSGVLMARRAVQAVVRQAVADGVDYFRAAVQPPAGNEIKTTTGESIRAETFVLACGSWLPKLFPEVIGDRIRATRQEVFFFGAPAGDNRFAPPSMPAWIDFCDVRGAYALPDLENRGLKVAFDERGRQVDPDLENRQVEGLEMARAFLAERFPALVRAPLVEARVCQYEVTSSGDFLIDRHPEHANIWFAGGGSGHGFKHAPMVGEYAAAAIDRGSTPDARFALATKSVLESRTVY